MSEEPADDPKLIIDEDWKTKVEREKEELKRQAQEKAEKPEESSEPVDESSADSAQTDEQPAQTPPPASFSFLLTSLATQAMAALGQLAGDDGKPMPVNLDYARHFIDLMGMLEEKTKGNLDEEEEKFVQESLHQMRMMFVTVSKRTEAAQNSAAQNSSD